MSTNCHLFNDGMTKSARSANLRPPVEADRPLFLLFLSSLSLSVFFDLSLSGLTVPGRGATPAKDSTGLDTHPGSARDRAAGPLS